jgi:hypothetical protein
VKESGGHTCLCARCRKRHIQRPLLPAHILVGLAEEIRLSPPLLEELHDQLPAASLLVCALNGADERNGALVDQRLEVDVVDGGQREVEQVPRQRGYGGKVSVEEDGVQDGWAQSVSTRATHHSSWAATTAVGDGAGGEEAGTHLSRRP